MSNFNDFFASKSIFDEVTEIVNSSFPMRCLAASTVVKNQNGDLVMYALGGSALHSTNSGSYYANGDLYELNLTNGTNKIVRKRLLNRYGMHFFSYVNSDGDTILIYGGGQDENDEGAISNLRSYNVNTDTITTLADGGGRSIANASIRFNGDDFEIFLAGNYTDAASAIKYTSSTDEWSSIVDAPDELGKSRAAVLYTDANGYDKFVCFGRNSYADSGDSGYFNYIYTYDIETDSWIIEDFIIPLSSNYANSALHYINDYGENIAIVYSCGGDNISTLIELNLDTKSIRKLPCNIYNTDAEIHYQNIDGEHIMFISGGITTNGFGTDVYKYNLSKERKLSLQ